MVFAATDPSVVAAILAATGAIVAGVFSLRSRAGADLVDDVMADRKYLKEEVAALRGEVDAMKLQQAETETALLACRQREAALKARVAILEERRHGGQP